ncbi:hypothetical protein ACOI22_09725 [Glaciecola sp. 2405UD65-10]|uniref:hypothetical protein n=1 Tax=Glaciecola sp. 2405UD65-10 TaxID=3397244 RepID=UPI003B591A1D
MTPFLSSTAFAQQQALPETATFTEAEQQARIEAINKAQWDGALAIKSFTLPGLDNTASTGVGDDGVVSDLTDYQDADGNHRFDSIKMDQMFQGFSVNTYEKYLSQLSDMSDEAHKIKDASADFQVTINGYDDIVCDDLQGSQCNMS